MLLPKECEKLIFSYLGIKYKKKCRATTHLNRICSLKCNNNILCDKHKKILFEKDNNGLKLIGNISLYIELPRISLSANRQPSKVTSLA